jgi:transcriptional regulator with XRE-family HTH domain
MSKSINVGEKIKNLRESKDITREELSERSGLNLDQIVSIEENTNLPSLAPLIKIARVMGMRLGTFLDDNEELGPVVTRKTDKDKSISFSNNAVDIRKHMEYFSLSKAKSGRHMEPFIIDILATETEFSLSSHEGEEFIYVLEGTVEINYGKDTYLLEPGDSIYYDSIVAHHVHAYPNTTAKILAVVYTPI